MFSNWLSVFLSVCCMSVCHKLSATLLLPGALYIYKVIKVSMNEKGIYRKIKQMIEA